MAQDEIASLGSKDLVEWMRAQKPFYLLDVRTAPERLGGHLGGMAIPMDQLESEWSTLPTDAPIIVYCRSGCRSATAIERLKGFGFTGQLFNLDKGILGIAKDCPHAIQSSFIGTKAF